LIPGQHPSVYTYSRSVCPQDAVIYYDEPDGLAGGSD
jgi:hypothetical protein